MEHHPDWAKAMSYERYVIQLFIDQKTGSEEFQRLLRLRGREHLKKIWDRWRAGDYSNADPPDERPHSVIPTVYIPREPEPIHAPAKGTPNPKAKSFVERSCPNDDL